VVCVCVCVCVVGVRVWKCGHVCVFCVCVFVPGIFVVCVLLACVCLGLRNVYMWFVYSMVCVHFVRFVCVVWFVDVFGCFVCLCV